MFSGGKKNGTIGQKWVRYNHCSIWENGERIHRTQQQQKKKDHPYNFLKLNFRAGPALPINKRFWIKFYFARTYFL